MSSASRVYLVSLSRMVAWISACFASISARWLSASCRRLAAVTIQPPALAAAIMAVTISVRSNIAVFGFSVKVWASLGHAWQITMTDNFGNAEVGFEL